MALNIRNKMTMFRIEVKLISKEKPILRNIDAILLDKAGLSGKTGGRFANKVTLL